MADSVSGMMSIDDHDAVHNIEESKSFGSCLSMSMNDGDLMLSLSAESDSHSISSKGMKLPSVSEQEQQRDERCSRERAIKSEEREPEPEGRDDASVSTRSAPDGPGHRRTASAASNASGSSARSRPSPSKVKSSPSQMKGKPGPAGAGPHHPRPHSAYGHGPPQYGHGPPPQGQPRHPGPPPHMGPPHPGAPYPPYYGGPPPHHPHYQQGPRRGPPPPQGPPGRAPGPPPPHGYGPPHGHGGPPPHHPHSMPPHHWGPYPPQHGGHPYPPPHYRGGPPPPGHYQQQPGGREQGPKPGQSSSASAGGGKEEKDKTTGSSSKQARGEHGSPSMSVGSSSSSKTSGSRKKRTIDGVREQGEGQGPGGSAFHSHRSTDSTASSTCSSASTSRRTNPAEDSPQKGKAGNAGGGGGSMLPPRSSGTAHPSSQTISLFSDEQMRHHRRTNSSASTASSLSVGGMSMSSLVGKESQDQDDTTMLEASPKRRRHQGSSRPPHYQCSPGSSSTRARLDHLTVKDEPTRLTLSASPINHVVDPGKTPVSKNTNKNAGNNKNSAGKIQTRSSTKKDAAKFNFNQDDDKDSKKPVPQSNTSSAFRKKPVGAGSSSTPALYSKRSDSNSLSFDLGEMMNDDPLLNRHLRGQSFTPLPHVSNGGDDSRRPPGAASPTFNPALSSIAPQLSWGISGTPTLGDIADWADVKPKEEQKRGEGGGISPMSVGAHGESGFAASMSFWQDDEVAAAMGDDPASKQHERGGVEELSGKMTPLPIFFDQAQGGEERENQQRGGPNVKYQPRPVKTTSSGGRGPGDTEHIHQMFVSNGSGRKLPKPSPQNGSRPMPLTTASSWALESPRLPQAPLSMSKSPHHYQGPEQQRDDAFSRGRGGGGGRRDGPPPIMHSPNNMFGPHQRGGMMGQQGDRVRNLRGRAPHGAPPSLHIPPHVASSHQHNLTSPMVGGMHKPGMWGSPIGAHPAHQHLPSPHHLNSPHAHLSLDLTPSKRKCIPLKPPIPSKFQGDMDKMKGAQVPEFTSLVNFPVHISQKQAMNLPDGMRCCVMCGQACPCSAATKNKKGGGHRNKAASADPTNPTAPLGGNNNNGQPANPYAIIPTQNKGLCTMCDVNVWIVVQSGLEIKWCKGCKNFRPWAAFGDKGLATKCVRCRERQREKYAAQKEEKEKARLIMKNAAKPLHCA